MKSTKTTFNKEIISFVEEKYTHVKTPVKLTETYADDIIKFAVDTEKNKWTGDVYSNFIQWNKNKTK